VSDPNTRESKIIVALFLMLGKCLNALPANQRNFEVTETEMRKAWEEQKSPVRLVSEHRAQSFVDDGDKWNHQERVFKCVMGELDLHKTGLNFQGKMPEEPKVDHLVRPGRRVFDLE